MRLRAPQVPGGGRAPATFTSRPPTQLVYQITVTLNGIRPPVWRRLLIEPHVSLHRLHRVLQLVMGWEDCHLYELTIQGARYGIPDPEDERYGRKLRDAKRTRLHQVAGEGDRLTYRYDFGDGWNHDLLIEAVHPRESKTRYPVCVAGKYACPPEDCGGLSGYAEFLKAISDPAHERHEELLTWIGGSFDPERFDLDAVNARLRRLR